ncbi:dCMP deaminase [Morganella phage vB_MmoM_MP1]|uniref:Deoxycytidylate deaminase n=1 Tax=Morganella phage vB_MmoM_MP1 TaxID=1852628 RepID=A0A192YC90_9CAUD|nr:dCMP deaminase [Morganella phage vB_MmoM_MP1]ANM46481.1 deoxycytidylate deaminase [Morganella phage vB_MmoM_MP1]
MKATTYLQIAYLVSQESKCCSWKVGAVIAKDDRIIATGYNGSPSGQTNCCDHAEEKGWTKYFQHQTMQPGGKTLLLKEHREDHSKWSAVNEIHAELNAIIFAAKKGISIEGGTMYVTLSPCADCAKAIAQSGIKTLVYAESYDKLSDGWDQILVDSGIEVVKFQKSHLKLLDFTQINTFNGES